MRKVRVLTMALVAVVLLLGEACPAQETYSVEHTPLQVVLSGEPSPTRPAEYVQFRLRRNEGEGQSLYFSLSDLEDSSGNKFPRELIVLKTPYDSRELRWAFRNEQQLLLHAEDDYIDLELGVYYHELVPAGTYRGSLYSEFGGKISLEIEVAPFTNVAVYPSLVTVAANEGPGIYKASEPVQVRMWANHSDWLVEISSGGLFYQSQRERDEEDRQLVHPSDVKIDPVPLLFSNQVAPEERHQSLSFRGSEYGSGAILEFEIWAQIGWEHPAGHYSGVVTVDVEIEE